MSGCYINQFNFKQVKEKKDFLLDPTIYTYSKSDNKG